MTKNVLEKYKIVPCREAPPAPAEDPAEGAAQNSTNLSASLGGEDARKTSEYFFKIDNKKTMCFVVSMERERDRASMLAPQNVRLQMFNQSQRGKKDDINFTLEVHSVRACFFVSSCVLSLNVLLCTSRSSIANYSPDHNWQGLRQSMV